MKKERILIEDDRYLIYYTFDDETPSAAPDGNEPAKNSDKPEQPKPHE